jgi:hypothetical protein
MSSALFCRALGASAGLPSLLQPSPPSGLHAVVSATDRPSAAAPVSRIVAGSAVEGTKKWDARYAGAVPHTTDYYIVRRRRVAQLVAPAPPGVDGALTCRPLVASPPLHRNAWAAAPWRAG